MSPYLQPGAEGAADIEVQQIYELHGVVVHSGTATSGHYWSLVKEPVSGRWVECNDMAINTFDEGRISEVRLFFCHGNTCGRTDFVLLPFKGVFREWQSIPIDANRCNA